MRVTRFRHSLICACAAVLLCYGQEAETVANSSPILSLDDALSLARKQNAQIQIATLDVTKAVEQTDQLKAQRLPVFKVYANIGASLIPIDLTIPRGALGSFPATGPVPAQDASIKTPQRLTGIIYGTAGQPLSQLYKLSLGVKESRLGEEMAREKARQQSQQTTEQVRQTYYQLTRLQSQIASAEVSIKYLDELVGYTERNLAQETVLKSDLLSVKAKLSQARYQLLTLRDNLATEKEALNRLLGRDLRIDFAAQLEPAASRDETSLTAAQNKALEQRPEIRQARLQARKAELDLRREKAEYLPDLSAQVSYLSFANVNFLPKNIVTAGFLLEWQPFDWGLKRHKMDELRSTSKQAVLTEHDAQQQILLDVNSSYRRLAEARSLLEVAAAAQEVEREKLRIVMNRYQEKAALLTDVLQQQSELAQADTQYQQDLANLWTAKSTFDRAMGGQ